MVSAPPFCQGEYVTIAAAWQAEGIDRISSCFLIMVDKNLCATQTMNSVQTHQCQLMKSWFVYFWTLNAHHGKHVLQGQLGQRVATETKRNIRQWSKTLNSWSVQVGVLFLFIFFLCVKNKKFRKALSENIDPMIMHDDARRTGYRKAGEQDCGIFRNTK